MSAPATLADPASFRDPDGYVYRDEQGELLRQVNRSYEPDFAELNRSGLCDELIGSGLLVEHDEVALERAAGADAAYVLRPRELPFVSYPYEWSFSMLKQAALLTLDIQQRSLAAGMTLKDATAFNVQFDGARPVFIDTLSFERYQEGQPWPGYGQFCRHFLAPLALMSYRDVRLNDLLCVHLDGVPLDLAARLLPLRTRWRPSLLIHLHLHAKAVSRYADTSGAAAAGDGSAGQEDARVEGRAESVPAQQARKPSRAGRLSRRGLETVLDSLRRTVERLGYEPSGTEWADYYSDLSYDDRALAHKQQIVGRYLDRTRPASVWDLGANTGRFSRLAARRGAFTVAFDIDPACVERNYLACRAEELGNLLPLRLDLTNPSPALGWAHEERRSLAGRGPADVVMALALVHHLAIANNIPLGRIAAFLAPLCRFLVIEFVPKSDPQVQRLLRGRKDIFDRYTQAEFESQFAEHFDQLDREAVGGDGRVMYLFAARD